MLTEKQENIRCNAIEHARLVNDVLDCDYIQDCINGVLEIHDIDEIDYDCNKLQLSRAINRLASAILFRKPDDVRSKLYADMFEATLTRLCARCGEKLEEGDDLICGYHHLES